MGKTHPDYEHSLPPHGPQVAGRGDTRGPALVIRRPFPDQGSEWALALAGRPAGHRWQPLPPAQRSQWQARRSAGRPGCGCSPEPPPRGRANSASLGATRLPSTFLQKQA